MVSRLFSDGFLSRFCGLGAVACDLFFESFWLFLVDTTYSNSLFWLVELQTLMSRILQAEPITESISGGEALAKGLSGFILKS